ncbi:MAG: AI-2E family transporter [Deltaproteobacteria bacterium]|nr:AI-2E family transporter [Deltaproteobacteria bacterium]
MIKTPTFALNPVVAVIIATAVLYAARQALIPLALAVLLGFALSPLVDLLERSRIPRAPAVWLSILFAAAVSSSFVWFCLTQLVELTGELPSYTVNLERKISDIGGPIGDAVHRFQSFYSRLKSRADKGEAVGGEPVQVEVVGDVIEPVEFIQRAIQPIVNPLLTAALVVVFAIFILFYRRNLRDRLVRLIAGRHLGLTTLALDETAERVSKFLLAQLLVCTLYGAGVAAGLYFLSVPKALLFGLITIPLRFVPYIGAWLSAVPPILLSIGVSPGWGVPLAVIALFVLLEFVISNFVEPIIYGATTGLHPLAVLFSAVFWTWLWGGLGLMIATPLTVCLAVIGRYVPSLHWLALLLGDEPPLADYEMLYQRLLAEDHADVEKLVEKYSRGEDTSIIYDRLLIPAALTALEEYEHDGLEDATLHSIFRSFRSIASEFKLVKSKSGIELVALEEDGRLLASIIAKGIEGDNVTVIHGSDQLGAAMQSDVKARLIVLGQYRRELIGPLKAHSANRNAPLILYLPGKKLSHLRRYLSAESRFVVASNCSEVKHHLFPHDSTHSSEAA